MKKVIFSIAAIYCAFSLYGMETDNNNNNNNVRQYPAGMAYMPIDEVLNKVPSCPENIKKAVDNYLVNNPTVVTWCKASTEIISKEQLENFNQQQVYATINTFKGNTTANGTLCFPVYNSQGNKAIAKIKIANLKTRMHSLVATQKDPYMIKDDHVFYNNYQQASSLNLTCIQHCTIAIAQHLLNKYRPRTIKHMPTWLHHISSKTQDTLDDSNYVCVQTPIEKEYPEFVQFSQLSDQVKKDVLKKINFKEVYQGAKTIHYAFLTEPNIYVNPLTGEIVLPETVSPDNENSGNDAPYGSAITGTPFNKALKKAMFNVRNPWDGGHRKFQEVIEKYGDDDDWVKWMSLYKDDTIYNTYYDDNKDALKPEELTKFNHLSEEK